MRLCLLLSLALLCLGSANAKVENVDVQRDDRALIPLSEPFGFDAGGRLDIELSSVDIFVKHDKLKQNVSTPVNFDNFGFFVTPADDEVAFEQEIMDARCPLADDDKILFTFSDAKVLDLISGAATSMKFSATIENGGQFFLYFANCEDMVPVSFKARVDMYNFNSKGRKDFLSVGETELVAVYWVRGSPQGAENTATWLLLCVPHHRALSCIVNCCCGLTCAVANVGQRGRVATGLACGSAARLHDTFRAVGWLRGFAPQRRPCVISMFSGSFHAVPRPRPAGSASPAMV